MPDLSPVRVALQQTMAATAADEQAHHLDTYAAIRPLVVPRAWKPGQPVRADCSKGCQFICRWTENAPDPMRNGWGMYGNSSTIWMELEHIPLSAALPGDLVTFGFSGDHHVAMLYKFDDGAWSAWNFGRQGQPAIVPLAYEIADHQGLPVTVCQLGPLPPATKAEKLRAMTGFWPWLAWYLGEGQHTFKPYGARNPKVRPSVPQKIPAEWWQHEKQFLANRQSGNP